MVSISEILNIFRTGNSVDAGRISPSNEQLLFDNSYDKEPDVQLDMFADTAFTDTLKGRFLDFEQKAGIKSYKPTVLKTDIEAIKASHKSLVDLLKFYEGDRYHYYEAVTVPYQDKYGTWTCGFGTRTNRRMTREEAYDKLLSGLEATVTEAKRTLTPEIYNKLPQSIKEGVIDLCYNKGQPALNRVKTQIINAANTGDWSEVINNLDYVQSAKSTAEKVDDPGLYRRSFSRMILASRDLSGKELEETKKVIEDFYTKARDCENQSIDDLDKIYDIFKTGTTQRRAVSRESIKHQVVSGESYFAIAKKYCPEGEDIQKFVEELQKINYKVALQPLDCISVPINFNGKSIKNSPLSTQKPNESSSSSVNKGGFSISVKSEVSYFKLVQVLLPADFQTGDYYKPLVEEILRFNGVNNFSYDKDGYPEVSTLKPGVVLNIPDKVIIKGKEILLNQEISVPEFKILLPDENNKTELDSAYVAIDTVYTVPSGGSYYSAARYFYPELSAAELKKITKELEAHNGNKVLHPGMQVSCLPNVNESLDLTEISQSDVKPEDEEKTVPMLKQMLEQGMKYSTSPIGAANSNLSLLAFTYNVQKGEGILSIATKFDIDWKTLRDFNGLNSKSILQLGQEIKIPKIVYTVKSGDNLIKISEKFSISKELLVSMNDIEEQNSIKVGEKFALPGYAYTVKSGDNLTLIAKNAGISVNVLKDINGLKSNIIKPGQKLVILYNDGTYNVEKETITVVDNTGKTVKKTVNKSDRTVVGNRQYLVPDKVCSRHVFEPTNTSKDAPLKGKTIIVNAGHGYKANSSSYDPGAIAEGMPEEWLLTYDHSMRLISELQKRGAKVIYLQGHKRSSIYKALQDKKNKADMFISIHMNSGNENTRDRTEFWLRTKDVNSNNNSNRLVNIAEKNFDTWIKSNETISNEEAYFASNEQRDYARIQHDSSQKAGKKYRLGLLDRVQEHMPGIPSLIWEVAFMGTPKGNSRIKDEKIMKNYAIQMAESIEQYYEQSNKYKKHKVQSGDTLGKIAKKYGVSLESLKKHNGLTSNNIRVGQVLEIPPKP